MNLMEEVKKKTSALHEICEQKGIIYFPQHNWPSKLGDHGDDCLWLGIMSTQGIHRSFEGLIGCQESTTGQFWRSPERRRTKNAPFTNPVFSRDMAMGVLLGFSRSGFDHIEHFLRRWVSFIMSKPKNILGVPMYKLADGDDSCLIVTPVIWGLMEKLFRAKGCSTSSQMRRWRGYDDTTEFYTVETCSGGFELHLHALGAYLRFLLKSNEKKGTQIARKCFERNKQNLFYKVLSQKGIASEDDLKKFLEICPEPSTFEPKPHWCWEKADVENYYKECCGWDFVFLGKLLTKGI